MTRKAARVVTRTIAVLGAISLAAVGCGSDDGGGGGGEGSGGTVALLLPETKTARYEEADRPFFTQKMKQLCPDCEIEYSNADQKADVQQQQAEAALTKGIDVMVLDPVDGKAAANIVAKAKQQDVPVISYDRLASGPVDYYVSFDNERVGQLQGESLLKALGNKADSGEIVMINGAPTDPNAAQFKKGALSVLEGQVDIGKSYDTPDWSPDKAQQEMEQGLTALGKDSIVGVYAANDGTAGGAIAAMKSAGVDPLPPVTGQDAELAGVQRIVAGEQYMTVYKAIKPEAERTAEIAYALLQDKKPTDVPDTVNNGTKDVPSVLLTPVAVTQDNIADTVVKDDYHSVDEICAGRYASACSQIGLN